MKDPKTQRGAVRQYRSLLNRYRREYGAGGMFGFDWPTLKSNAPDVYARLRHLRAIHASLPT